MTVLQLSVVIPAFNAVDVLPDQLQALSAQVGAPAFEVLICDNGSTDATAELARGWHALPELRIVDASGRRGASYARNQGIRAAKAPVVAFVDADDIVAEDWAAKILSGAKRNVLVQGYLSMSRLNPECCYSGGGVERTLSKYGSFTTVGSGNIVMFRDDAIRIGGFDESFRHGAEDSDIAIRAQRAGMTVEICDATVHCRLRTDNAGYFRQQRTYGRGGIQLRLRHADVVPPVFSALGSLKRVVRGFPTFLRARTAKRPSLEGRAVIEGFASALGQLEGHWVYRVLKRLPDGQYLKEAE